jgi:hypothetical protein
MMLRLMTPERFAAIRKAVMQRQMDKLAAEIAATTDWDKLPHFNVDDFFKYLDSLVEQSETPPPRSRKRRKGSAA